ncbi:MAG: hypothetical protein HYS61_02360 [Acidobacteria bacterium]|nr:hypothetical protein [Acidobacteriota bacterium]
MRWLLIALIALGAWQWWGDRSIERAPGVMVAAAPEQRAIAGNPPQFQKKGYTLTALARFTLTARVLGVERYYFDRESDLVPVDLTLGWGPMSDTGVLSKVSISQGGRFYYWRVNEFPIPRREIEVNSANMHLIAATPAVERELKRVRVGSIVQLSGYLVEARAGDGWRWRSSLTREDTGAGACELIWVEQLELR